MPSALGHRSLIILGLQGHQDLAGSDVLVVVHQNFGHPPIHPGRNNAHITGHVGVVGADKDVDMPPVGDPSPDHDQDQQANAEADEKFTGHGELALLGEKFIDGADGPEHLGLGHLVVIHRGPVIDPGPGQEGLGVDDVGGGARRFLYTALR